MRSAHHGRPPGPAPTRWRPESRARPAVDDASTRRVTGKRRRPLRLTALTVVLAAGVSAVGGAAPVYGAASGSAFCAPASAGELTRPYVVRYGLTGAELQREYFDADTGLNGKGYRPVRLTGYRAGRAVRYATKWVKRTGPKWYGRFGLTRAEFDAEHAERRTTHRLVDVSGYNVTGGGVRFAAVWERAGGAGQDVVRRDVSRAGMQALVDHFSDRGYLPLRVDGYSAGGALRYVTVWVKDPCGWAMHNKMSRAQYEQRLTAYRTTHRLVHIESFGDDGKTWYAGIWWRKPGSAQHVRTNRDWYRFQRYFNNYKCDGSVLANFYVANVPGATRFGGIWTEGEAPQIGAGSPFASRVAQEVDCASGRAGASVVNLTTAQVTHVHADAPYGTSSTIKSAILYSLLRHIDATPATLTTEIDVGAQYGANQGDTLTAGTTVTLAELARTMIDHSNNWATNRLIDYLGMDDINGDLQQLGFDRIRLRRYMTGTGAPSAHGNAGPGSDYREGHDNTASPRQYALFLRRMHLNGGLLTPGSWTFYWNTMGLNGNGYDAVLDAGVGASWPAVAALAAKGGSNTWSVAPKTKPQLSDSHRQRSAAGRVTLANGQTVVYAAFVDEADGSAAVLQDMIDCVVMHAVREYSGHTSGADVAACRAG